MEQEVPIFPEYKQAIKEKIELEIDEGETPCYIRVFYPKDQKILIVQVRRKQDFYLLSGSYTLLQLKSLNSLMNVMKDVPRVFKELSQAIENRAFSIQENGQIVKFMTQAYGDTHQTCLSLRRVQDSQKTIFSEAQRLKGCFQNLRKQIKILKENQNFKQQELKKIKCQMVLMQKKISNNINEMVSSDNKKTADSVIKLQSEFTNLADSSRKNYQQIAAFSQVVSAIKAQLSEQTEKRISEIKEQIQYQAQKKIEQMNLKIIKILPLFGAEKFIFEVDSKTSAFNKNFTLESGTNTVKRISKSSGYVSNGFYAPFVSTKPIPLKGRYFFQIQVKSALKQDGLILGVIESQNKNAEDFQFADCYHIFDNSEKKVKTKFGNMEQDELPFAGHIKKGMKVTVLLDYIRSQISWYFGNVCQAVSKMNRQFLGFHWHPVVFVYEKNDQIVIV